MGKKIATTFDDHDHAQLVLLARMNKIKLTDMVRKIVRFYLDGHKAPQP
jgi:hypothetical protein